MDLDSFRSLFDETGRLLHETRFRKLVFEHGLAPETRLEAWLFLFKFYPYDSTFKEREVHKVEHEMRYRALKTRWKSMVTEGEQMSRPVTSSPADDDPILSYTRIQAELWVGKMLRDVTKEKLQHEITAVTKDVGRTDYAPGLTPTFKDELFDMLVSFAALHLDIGYVQGMNDLLARFLHVLPDQAKAFWCFTNYVLSVADEFSSEGMVDKLKSVKQLVFELDVQLYSHLEKRDIADFTFCHRWLLLGFHRELTIDDSVRCFEKITSHHLELDGIEGEKEREQLRKQTFKIEGGSARMSGPAMQRDFAFDLFLCVATLSSIRDRLLLCGDEADVFTTLQSLSHKINLDQMIDAAKDLFYQYCKKSVYESFILLETDK